MIQAYKKYAYCNNEIQDAQCAWAQHSSRISSVMNLQINIRANESAVTPGLPKTQILNPRFETDLECALFDAVPRPNLENEAGDNVMWVRRTALSSGQNAEFWDLGQLTGLLQMAGERGLLVGGSGETLLQAWLPGTRLASPVYTNAPQMNESHVIPTGAASVPAMYDYSTNVGRGTLSSSGTNDKFSRRQFFGRWTFWRRRWFGVYPTIISVLVPSLNGMLIECLESWFAIWY